MRLVNIGNRYLKFSLNLAIILLLTLISDQFIGRILKYYYFRQESGLFYRTTYAIDSTTADILVFGSSRASHHYVPDIFEDSLNMSFYNSGREGRFLLYNYAVFRATVKRHTPKIVIFDINSGELYHEEYSYERLSSLLPYYKTHPEIRDIIELRGKFEKYKLVSEIYPYNSSLLTIAGGNKEFSMIRKEDIKGYVPLLNVISDTIIHSIKPDEGIFDTNKMDAVNDIINTCKKNNIQLIFIQSPLYAELQKTELDSLFEKLTLDNKVPFLNFINDSELLNMPELFQDQYHLNERGARYFSGLVVEKIKELKKSPQSKVKVKV